MAINNDDLELLKIAQKVRLNAYAPYSNFLVGCAVKSKVGKIYVGTNMENASYGLTVCAEVAALSNANSENDFLITTVAIVGGVRNFTVGDIVMPCGRCRQLISEAADVSGVDIRVISANADLSMIRISTLKEILPFSFNSNQLKDLK